MKNLATSFSLLGLFVLCHAPWRKGEFQMDSFLW
jgi:hypothetical protein